MTDSDAQESKRDRKDGVEGIDPAALGTAPPPQTAPPGASVDPSEETVPGANKGDRLPTESKPWFTSLAADSDQAGVGNEPDDPDQ
jgi:hypothetical protein